MEFMEVCEVKLGVGQDMEGLCFIHLLWSRTRVHFEESGGCDASLIQPSDLMRENVYKKHVFKIDKY